MASTTTEPSRTPPSPPPTLDEALSSMKLDDLAHLLALTAPDPGKVFGEEDVLSLLHLCGSDLNAALACLDREEFSDLWQYLVRRGLMAVLGGVRLIDTGSTT